MGRRRERQGRRRCLTMLGLQGASSTARGKSTQCPSSSHTRHSVEKRKRERGVLVFPASISIRSQPLQSDQRGGNHTSCSSSVLRDLTVPTRDGCADESACPEVGYRKLSERFTPTLEEERGDESGSPVFCCVRSTMKLPCWMALALLLLLAQTVLAQRRISRPSDDESSGDGFYDDEDLFSGSGSGFPDMDVSPTAAGVVVTTEEPLPLSTTQATGPAPSASPAAEPSSPPPPEVEHESGLGQDVDRDSKLEMEIEKKWEELEEEEMRRAKEQDREQESEIVTTLDADKVQDGEEEQERSKATVAPRLTDVPLVFVDSSTALDETTVATSDPEDEDLYITAETIMLEASSTPETTTEDITTTEIIPTTVASTTAKPTRPRPALTTPSTAPVRPRKPHTTPSRATPTESSTRSVMTTTQTPTPAETVNNEVAGPGPSGDFEIRENEGRQGNEVRRGKGEPGMAGEPDLSGNTVDAAGSSAAQLPQKNILERKEVLIAVIVGGVVGALFAAFLVMLLVYRMKKKDEGSYTLEEPKQATVTYQKPDKQEEFYA
ncbi:syndecan-3 [Onychostoma macrolepis]|uniref:Syndecan n=1 Tax=Onychostoma macrolepis TaxID=369639 RepID=A0A7J6BZJ7_9TELE|nr:syndecan-3 [Onychostoma macrolepis]KAF4100449.1 hypothetical protein G5714_018645 [Onychostoma macrolepis]